jgi:hypothetical protein
MYPQKPLFEYSKASEYFQDMGSRFELGWFPTQRLHHVSGGILAGRTAEHTAQLTENAVAKGSHFYTVELDEHGFLAYRANIMHEGFIAYKYVIQIIVGFLSSAAHLFKEIGFWGQVDFSCQIRGAQGQTMSMANLFSPAGLSAQQMVDETAIVQRSMLVPALVDQLENELLSILAEFAWSCNISGADDPFHKDVLNRSGILTAAQTALGVPAPAYATISAGP